mmetsp:Transcript_44397/g.126709  ORF Transcript_44397/g.126709 Transcript_44397/m.126709 type:complete len:223 (-) Transcript_44397:969-1637(-)
MARVPARRAHRGAPARHRAARLWRPGRGHGAGRPAAAGHGHVQRRHCRRRHRAPPVRLRLRDADRRVRELLHARPGLEPCGGGAQTLRRCQDAQGWRLDLDANLPSGLLLGLRLGQPHHGGQVGYEDDPVHAQERADRGPAGQQLPPRHGSQRAYHEPDPDSGAALASRGLHPVHDYQLLGQAREHLQEHPGAALRRPRAVWPYLDAVCGRHQLLQGSERRR